MSVLRGDVVDVLRELADFLDEERAKMERMRDNTLEQAALIADQVKSTARPGHGKNAAAEIGRGIRALKEGTR